jgi:hypothetical protein
MSFVPVTCASRTLLRYSAEALILCCSISSAACDSLQIRSDHHKIALVKKWILVSLMNTSIVDEDAIFCEDIHSRRSLMDLCRILDVDEELDFGFISRAEPLQNVRLPRWYVREPQQTASSGPAWCRWRRVSCEKRRQHQGNKKTISLYDTQVAGEK